MLNKQWSAIIKFSTSKLRMLTFCMFTQVITIFISNLKNLVLTTVTIILNYTNFRIIVLTKHNQNSAYAIIMNTISVTTDITNSIIASVLFDFALNLSIRHRRSFVLGNCVLFDKHFAYICIMCRQVILFRYKVDIM